MVIEPIDDEDPVRIFNADEQNKLTRNLYEISTIIRTIDCRIQAYSIDLICSWHKHLFAGVRDHAGRYRTADYGEDRLTFGPHRSIARANVLSALSHHIDIAHKLFSQLDDSITRLDPLRFVEECVKVALYLHADLINIHPFRDGNGRVGRLIITFILSKYGLPPLAVEVPRQEYIQCLNHFYNSREIEPLLNLALRIYRNQLL